MSFLRKRGVYYPTSDKDRSFMMMMKKKNKKSSKFNKSENFAYCFIKDFCRENKLTITRQGVRGGRIFDFWIYEKGIAIECDGWSHDSEKQLNKDIKYDRYLFERSGIIVLRIPNMSYDGIERCIKKIHNIGDRKVRRNELGITENKISNTKKNDYWEINDLYFGTSSKYYKKINKIKPKDDLFDDFFDVPMLNIVGEEQKKTKTKNKKIENIKQLKTTISIEKKKEISSVDVSTRGKRVSMY